MKRVELGSRLTLGSLAALLGGILAGGWINAHPSPALAVAAEAIEPLGTVWVRGLQMVIVPLVVSLLVVAIVPEAGPRSVGRIGATTIGVFAGILIYGAVFTLLVAPPLVDRIDIGSGVVDSASPGIAESIPRAAGAAGSTGDLHRWIVEVVPSNPIAALMESNLLQVIAFTVLFALAASRIPRRRRRPLIGMFTAIEEAMFVLVVWILRFTPIGVFALSLAFARDLGLSLGGALLHYVAIDSGAMVVYTFLLYPAVAGIGRVPVGAFARAVYPGQLVALSTRSSLASLPALMEGARSTLRLPEKVIGFALPFSASVFKPNVTVSSTINVLFVARLYGISLSSEQILLFIVMSVLLSTASQGLPGGGVPTDLPAYLAVGIPPEGFFLLRAVDVIPDIFKTLVNSTSYLSVGVLLNRFSGMDVERNGPREATGA